MCRAKREHLLIKCSLLFLIDGDFVLSLNPHKKLLVILKFLY